MSSVRRSIASIATIVLSVSVLSAGVVAGAGPAAASGGNPPPVYNPPPGGGQTGSGSSGGGTYTATVAERISLSGDTNNAYNESWTPPECWLQPDFYQPQTYQQGDPSGGQSDADSYWFWFGNHFQGFMHWLHGTGGFDDVNQEFKQEQNKLRPAAWTGPDPIEADDVWWVPNWLNSPAGWACAQGLVFSDDLTDGFLSMEPPAKPGTGGANGQISSVNLAALARAALRLPTLRVVTSPRVSTEVNLPTYVSVVYGGRINPTDTATVLFGNGAIYLSATVQATLQNVQISSNATSYQTAGAGAAGQACAAAAGRATTACSITFGAPSGATPYTITVSATWTVKWTTSAGDGGTFPDAPPVTQTRNIVVREIQSQT